MSTPAPSILTGWWTFAVRTFAALTTRADVDACDRAVEQLARDSHVGALLHRTSVAIRQAWLASWSRALASRLAVVLMSASPASAWRVGGWMTAVTGATALALNQLALMPMGPLTWVVPSGLVAAGVAVMAAAAPLSRAAADRGLHGGGARG